MRFHFRIFLYVAAGFLLCFVVLFVWIVVYDGIAYRRAEITSILERDGKYDPASDYRFSRACVFPVEAGLPKESAEQRYREVAPIFPESHTHWTLVLLDDDNKTFRRLYGINERVRNEIEIVCAPNVQLSTHRSGDVLKLMVNPRAN